MRVNPNPMPDLMAALNQTQLEEQQAELQISTGNSVNEPSDDPTAAALLVENNDQATFNSGYLRSASPAPDRHFDAEFGHPRAATSPQSRRRGRRRHPLRERPSRNCQSTARHSEPTGVAGQYYLPGQLHIRRPRHECGAVRGGR